MSFTETDFTKNIVIFESKLEPTKGNIFYFHGGGFIFGSNNDLPHYHIDMITGAGYTVMAINYPLAPESTFSSILKYIKSLINYYAKSTGAPYFLWGRSAGAYLSLLVTAKGLDVKPAGIISYYGYGLLVPKWYEEPSKYYRNYPLIKYDTVKQMIGEKLIFTSPANPRFLIYLHARQTGTWIKTLSSKTSREFIEHYSLRKIDFSNFPPVLLAHNIRDTDVPFEESENLHHLIGNSQLLPFTAEDHDFDKNTDSFLTLKLLKATIQFLEQHI